MISGRSFMTVGSQPIKSNFRPRKERARRLISAGVMSGRISWFPPARHIGQLRLQRSVRRRMKSRCGSGRSMTSK